MNQQNAEPDIDFGDPVLNDPDYEANVDKQGDAPNATPDTTPPQDGGEQTPSQPQGADGAADRQPSDGSQPAQPGQPAAGQEPAPAAGDKPKAQPGDLTDRAGNVVAKAGPERRLYEKSERQSRYIQQLEGQVKQLQESGNAATEAQRLMDSTGLDASELQMGVNIIGNFKKDPLSVAQWALKETLAMGYNLQQIVGESAGGRDSIEMQAITKAIDDRIAPIVQQTQARQQETQQQTQVRERYNEFMAKHDNADVHEDMIAGIMKRNGSTPEAAYWQLRAYAEKSGFDFTKPLEPQFQARQQQQGQQPAAPAQPAPNGNAPAQPQPNQAPMPNGGAPTAPMQQGNVFADPDDAWDSIVSTSLREAGFN